MEPLVDDHLRFGWFASLAGTSADHHPVCLWVDRGDHSLDGPVHTVGLDLYLSRNVRHLALGEVPVVFPPVRHVGGLLPAPP